MSYVDDDMDGLGICAIVFGTVALFLTLFGNFWCGFATHGASLSSSDQFATDNLVTKGLWNIMDYQTYYTIADGSIYFSTLNYCVPYSNSVEFDPLWKSAMTFSIIATVAGGCASCGICFCVCASPVEQVKWRVFALIFLFTSLFQGLTFLYFPSKGCQGYSETVQNYNNDENITISFAKCALSHGANMSIAAVVLWFLSALIAAWAAKSSSAPPESEERINEKAVNSKSAEADSKPETGDEKAQTTL
mmetsp:Transcript_2587/g.3973  ORF Transcript_2587/g.3973 Transcript_2587/m.3973 type:complete len:248 (-) Transcript_2587:154-897(-)|eukprot:CAMPEP_0195511100 /NCGR_PEP_ID=MMETSP0794_2-20130614/3546_1 /TAXON_ID=515487 /ORGANISM="Stephanopyxis turris, Strain CCMP 815" /LENGTH=247 /DNA_ID=CAMNT_0040638647 /DNA_START=54 /DNA_END=797 /DNA_ORIENTATION=-